MSKVGSDLREITFNHPSLGTRTFYGKAGEDATFDPGGISHADEASGVDGGGNYVGSMTMGRWSLEATISYNDNSDRDSEYIKQLAGSADASDITASFLDGRVYVGQGFPVGDLAFNTKNATFPIKLSGGGEMKKLS